MADWKPPTEFDLVKELNTQAARLATLVGLLFTATAFTAGTSQLHDAITAGRGLQVSLVAIALALDLLVALVGLVYAMEPSVLLEPDATQDAWRAAVRRKGKACEEAGICALAAALTLACLWFIAAEPASGFPAIGEVSTWWGAAVVIGLSLGASLRAARGPLRKPRLPGWLRRMGKVPRSLPPS